MLREVKGLPDITKKSDTPRVKFISLDPGPCPRFPPDIPHSLRQVQMMLALESWVHLWKGLFSCIPSYLAPASAQALGVMINRKGAGGSLAICRAEKQDAALE